jgi:hypothetical protein
MSKPVNQVYIESLIRKYECFIAECNNKSLDSQYFDEWYHGKAHTLKIVIEDLQKLLKAPQLINIFH